MSKFELLEDKNHMCIYMCVCVYGSLYIGMCVHVCVCVYTKLRFGCLCLKVNTWETSVGWKGRIILFSRSAAWGGGKLMSKNQLPRFCLTRSPKTCFFKGRLIWRGSQGLLIIHCVHIFFWLIDGEVTGKYSRNLVLSLKLQSSNWVKAYIYIYIYIYIYRHIYVYIFQNTYQIVLHIFH